MIDLKGELGDDFDHHDPEHYRGAERAWAAMQAQSGLEYSRVLKRCKEVYPAPSEPETRECEEGLGIIALPLQVIYTQCAAESAEKV